MSVEFTPVGAEFVTTEYLCISSDNFKMTRQTSMTDINNNINSLHGKMDSHDAYSREAYESLLREFSKVQQQNVELKEAATELLNSLSYKKQVLQISIISGFIFAISFLISTFAAAIYINLFLGMAIILAICGIVLGLTLPGEKNVRGF
ncbi:hypothetical protein [Victivallis vadensis]|uniref:hypothetical protein n=1 Tax=Victivallis vadensis TaxID=172901 RepID=UPI0023F73D40|nr:hypothetical protein [Victivallis vadensis]